MWGKLIRKNAGWTHREATETVHPLLQQAAPSVSAKSWRAVPPGREWDSRQYPAWSLAALG